MLAHSAGRSPRSLPLRALAVSAAVAAGLVASAPAEATDVPTPDDFTNPDPSLLRDSVVDLDPNIVDLDENVEEAETTESSGSGAVITLATDILFEFDSAELSSQAAVRIAEIADDIPTGSDVTVAGHTDSKGEDSYNQSLSEERADAVAEVLAEAADDLEIEAEGFGESEPVASNGTEAEDDPEGRAENRRVEIHYED
ncbi:OmpA family protein [Brevibacterium jeotgali]|uniref:Outer membrane protein OmpA n=1 Tax=Brevibacterium jeotgali TaxID=1262550 RepID=A0A2H1L3R7_9MICO|nr:OmpA family protein [Brevibacterium jeotgali]TWC01685.1 outer membrane protein OmpA-like peptidoglycan-associated protein [Brevibacterium jeotgali]SMY11430.1 Outer membrane protein OmpA [Brevibacterium jeotgali]